MNVSDAKALFMYDTLIHISVEIAKDMGCSHQLKAKEFSVGNQVEHIDWIADF